jgi:hypothetical protein
MLAPGHLNIRIGRFRPINRAAFTDPARLPPFFNVLLSELSIEIWTVSRRGTAYRDGNASCTWKRFMVEASPPLTSALWN